MAVFWDVTVLMEAVSTRLPGTTFQKTAVFILVAVRT
jgi:hypothetical protein